MRADSGDLFFYSSRIIGAALLLLIYLYGLRPLRRAISQEVVLPIVTPHYNNSTHPYSIVNKGVALTFTFEWNEDLKTIRYQPQFGFFFLVTVIALIFITLIPKWYLWLIAFHLLSMIAVILILYFSRYGWYPGFIIVDFLVTYFIPGLSFAYAAFVWHAGNFRKFSKVTRS